ncbi:MAG TPA: cation:proton antiporter [Leptolyngbyaceae cyanobacterium M33_DOE_097]|uniref:Sodium:proton antiporter n=1 Tax=Oscillatoriales cyanobacterium SpSt-418 TaxID=2282169 RepID=A0A7C3PIU1_9CYAN|nr:cation:proton antiporter [Leptolyngbyaceae cyanobacterium M33_DOE_097]
MGILAAAAQSVKGEPIVAFVVLLAVILLIPPVFERIRLPGLVGLLAAGVILGPFGLKLLNSETDTMNLLSDIGLVYLMFVAGLEIELEQFQKTKNRSLGFGFFTFIVPLIAGTALGRLFGYDWNPAILIGSLLASHTLLAYPIVSRLGVVQNEAVTVTIGATIFTDIGALLVLAICVGIKSGNFTPLQLGILLGSLAIYTLVVLIGLNRLGKFFFRKSGDEEGNQFLFILLAVFLAAVGAQLIGIEKIVGAFLAGLAVNGVIGDSPVKEKVMFIGSVLFIPIFFVDMGLLINLPKFIESLTTPYALGLTVAITSGLIGSKFIAALLAKLSFRYGFNELMVMWSLSLPQVAATLAATLVGFREGLLREEVVNTVIVMMLVTSTLGPILTARFAPKLGAARLIEDIDADAIGWEDSPTQPMVAIVPVNNPQTERNLLELAALLTRNHSESRIVPLSIAVGHVHMNDPQLAKALAHSETLLDNAVAVSRELGVEAQPLIRIDDSIAQGINRAGREQNANLIVMGWGKRTGLQARLFGNVIDSVLWASHCPVAISRLLDSPTRFQRILIPIENLAQRGEWVIRFAHTLALANDGKVTLLHVCDRASTPGRIAWMESQLTLLAEKVVTTPLEICIQPHENVVRAVADLSQDYDLVILRSLPRRTSSGGLIVSDTTTQIAQEVACSVIMLGEPQSALAPGIVGTRSFPVPPRTDLEATT